MLEPDEDIMTDKETKEYVNENPGYDEVDDQDLVKAHYEESPEIHTENSIDNDKAYYSIPYWEPANKEEELMSQLCSTLKLQKIPAESVE